MKYDVVPSIEYRGVKISNICYENVKNMVNNTLNNGQRGYICLTDVSNLVVAAQNERLRVAINGSLLSLADGMPLVWYARMIGCKEIERISGASLMRRLITDTAKCRHYLLGDTEETIAKVIAEVGRISSNIEITGHSPPFKAFDTEDNLQMIEKINKSGSDIVWVCFGGGKQEQWMRENIGRLDKGIMIGVGAAFRFLVGDIITPPLIFQKMGLQWAFRITEAFIKNPVDCIKVIQKRQILSTKVSYVFHLPKEVYAARRTFKRG